MINGFARFTNITVPKGSVINAAKLTFVAQTSVSVATCKVKIFCNAADNATAPTSNTTHNGKVRSTAFVSWTVPGQTSGSSYDTPDIKSVVQEIIDRAGWNSGNALMVLIDDDGSSSGAYRLERSYDGFPATAALLTIDYQTATERSRFFRMFAIP